MTLRALTLSVCSVLVTCIGVACSASSGTDSTAADLGGTDTAPDSGAPDSTPDIGGVDADGSIADADGGTDGGVDGGGCGSNLDAVIRDFKGFGETGGHTDFEISGKGIIQTDGQVYKGWNDVGCGLVLPALGADKKPTFNAVPVTAAGKDFVGIGAQRRVVSGPGCYPALSGECNVGICLPWTDPANPGSSFAPPASIIQSTASFGDWYNTKAGVNMELKATLLLPETPPGSGIHVIDTNAFFPIDGQGFGNTPGQAHNFHFTTEIHVTFRYEAGQNFSFRGDDDLWVFINNKLALDVGGSHQALTGSIDFDAQAAALGIVPGTSYPMDIFHAERQTLESNFRIQTNIDCFVPVPVVK